MESRRERKVRQIIKTIEKMDKSRDLAWESERVPIKRGMWASVECARVDPDMTNDAERVGCAVGFEVYIVTEKEGDIFSASLGTPLHLEGKDDAWRGKAEEEIDYLLRCATDWD